MEHINEKIKNFKTTKIVDPQRSKKDPSLRSTLPWVTPFKTPQSGVGYHFVGLSTWIGYETLPVTNFGSNTAIQSCSFEMIENQQ